MKVVTFLLAAGLIIGSIGGCSVVLKCVTTNSHRCGFN
jgi:hypothetical protein